MTASLPVLLCFDGSEDARRAIVAIAAEEDAAVIVVGARGLSRAATVLGSVSARVSRHAGRPVLVVPPADDQPGGTPGTD